MPRRFLSLLALALALAACDSGVSEVTLVTEGVYVGNQGNFSDNNGSVTVFDPASGSAQQNAFGDLGGLVQSVFLDGARAFVLLNFSTGGGRIDVVDLESNTVTNQVEVGTPRQMVIVGTTAFVTDLFGGAVTPIDLTTFTAGAPIPVGDNPEGIVEVGGRVYVANSGFGSGSTVSVIDPSSQMVVETLDVGCAGPRSLVVDADREVWVFCTGLLDFDTGETIEDGEAVVLAGATGAEVARVALTGVVGAASLGQDAAVSRERAEAYLVQGSTLLRFDTAMNTLAGTVTPALPAGHSIGAVATDEAEGRLFLGAIPPDFVSAGTLVVTDLVGAQLQTAATGIAPASIAVQTGEE